VIKRTHRGCSAGSAGLARKLPFARCRLHLLPQHKTTKVAMPTLTPIAAISPVRRMRPAASGLLGGASSMLRLARAGGARLPSNAALAGWAERAAAMLDLTPMMVGPQAQIAAKVPSVVPGLAASRHGVRA
jgi:hypothetical protein